MGTILYRVPLPVYNIWNESYPENLCYDNNYNIYYNIDFNVDYNIDCNVDYNSMVIVNIELDFRIDDSILYFNVDYNYNFDKKKFRQDNILQFQQCVFSKAYNDFNIAYLANLT